MVFVPAVGSTDLELALEVVVVDGCVELLNLVQKTFASQTSRRILLVSVESFRPNSDSVDDILVIFSIFEEFILVGFESSIRVGPLFTVSP